MTCPICGATETVVRSFTEPFTYKGRHADLGPYEATHCQACNEEVVPAAVWKQMDADRAEFRKLIDTEVPDGAYVRQVRTKLGLSQPAAARLFGGGVNGFSRYELGKAEPSTSTMALLHLLDRHPDLLEEVRSVSR